ncbi:MAG: hypothetical protein QF831_04675, partial [Candidatus Thalassarchaeaceae archaeon]|nr:hypothetical protein [Candidatus Thalassarchaeaceae archaeon]
MDCPADTGAISQPLSTDEEYEIVPIDIDVSDLASQKLRELLNMEPNNVVLKVAVHRGGCSGYLYNMEIVDMPNEEGYQFSEVNGIQVA